MLNIFRCILIGRTLSVQELQSRLERPVANQRNVHSYTKTESKITIVTITFCDAVETGTTLHVNSHLLITERCCQVHKQSE